MYSWKVAGLFCAHGVLQLADGVRIQQVILAALAVLIVAADDQLGFRLGQRLEGVVVLDQRLARQHVQPHALDARGGAGKVCVHQRLVQPHGLEDLRRVVPQAVGLNKSLIDAYFPGTASRIEGIGLGVLAREALMKHQYAFQPLTESETDLVVGGHYQYREGGEYHLLNPLTISKVQHAVRENNFATFQEYTGLIDNQNRNLCTLRGLLKFKYADKPLAIEEVEPAKEIVKRFTTGAMSFGSI